MTYFPDLSSYEYEPSDRPMLNIGWLSSQHEHAKGLVAEVVMDALKVLGGKTMNQMRGYHQCDFCSAVAPSVLGGEEGTVELLLGSAELHVEGAGGVVYAAPDLVLHYILEHDYCPPREFCQAVLEKVGLASSDELTVRE